MDSLKILHVIRTPVGGAFRHLVDLAGGQAARGHRVGIICDSTTGGARAEATLAALATSLPLGVTRLPMPREPSPVDVTAVARARRIVNEAKPDVVHGHGAKGGALARLAADRSRIRVYTPHGGSLHYPPRSPQGLVYGVVERLLMRRTELFLFESEFAHQRFAEVISPPRGLVRVVHNGVRPEEFDPAEPRPDATDLVFVGELRKIKGPDLLIDAVAQLQRTGRKASLTLVGEGDQSEALRQQVARLGLSASVRFAGFQPARTAFGMGRILVIPSRNESLPYVAIEAAAAGLPVVAARIGGIPEIFGDQSDRLVNPDDADALAQAVSWALDHPVELASKTSVLRERVRQGFSQNAMVDGILAGYAEASHIVV